MEDFASAGVDEDGGGFHGGELRLADQVVVAGEHGDVEGEDVGFLVERGLIDGGGGEGEAARGDIEDVVVEDAHAKAVGGNVTDAAADAAHAQDTDGELV